MIPRAKEAALKALAIDETVADAHHALGIIFHLHEWNWSGAEREYRRALALNPGDTVAWSSYASLLGQLRHADAAIAEAQLIVERDPLSVYDRNTLSLQLSLARRFDQAIAEAEAGIELEPSHQGYCNLGYPLLALGRYDEAVQAFRQATIVAPADPLSQGYLGWALGLAGEKQEARAILDVLEQRQTQGYFSGWLMAHVNLGLGEHEEAIAWLQKAVEERDGLLVHMNVWWGVDPLRSDPRFQALLRRMNFPQQP